MIEVKNVTKKYANITAVNNISFDVKDGEIVGFLGQNGAGKTNTKNMITGFIEPTEGKIIVNGYDMSKKSKKAKKQIGYMPEGVPLYMELTVKEFITYMAELKLLKGEQKKEDVAKVIKETGLTLVSNPEVIILDEPTVGLDPKQITEIRSLIKELGKNHTVILSSHILSEISQICERVIIINNGKIVAIDTPENLEKKTKEKNTLFVTVEDPKGNMPTLKQRVPQIEEIKFLKDNEDNTKQYAITSNIQVDLRKVLFEVLPKEEITIFELKKDESSLEEAYIKLIDLDKQDQTSNETNENRKNKKKGNKATKEEKEKLKEEKKKQKEKQNEEKAEKKEAKEKEKKEKQEAKNKLKEENKKEGGKK